VARIFASAQTLRGTLVNAAENSAEPAIENATERASVARAGLCISANLRVLASAALALGRRSDAPLLPPRFEGKQGTRSLPEQPTTPNLPAPTVAAALYLALARAAGSLASLMFPIALLLVLLFAEPAGAS